MNGSFFKESCGRLRLSGNGCGQCKRFTAHCGEGNTMVAFLSVDGVSDRNGEFSPFLVAADQQPGHCSKSQNRRKCDGNGSNLQHLKDNWCGRIAGGKVG